MKSFLREVVVGGPDRPKPTGDAAYRAIIPTAEMIKDPDLKPFVDDPHMNAWMGPKRHIMMYNIVRVCFVSKHPLVIGFPIEAANRLQLGRSAP